VHADSIGTPPGHPTLTSFLGVPLVHDGKIMGMIGLANREGGYTPEHLQAVEAIAPAIVHALIRKRAEIENQRLQSEIQQERDTLAALMNNIPDEIWFFNAQQRFTLANPSALREFALDSVTDEEIESFVARLEVLRPDGSPRPIEESPALLSLRGEEVRNLEEIVRTPASGELRHRLVNSSPVMDVNGNVIGAVSTARDITERKRMEDELRESRDELELRVQERTVELERSNQALREFASIASHDMREPLRKVTTFGNMLRNKHKDSLGEQGNDYLNRMIDASNRMQVLLTSLLEYSRVTMNPEPFKEVDLCDIVHGVLSDLEIRIEKSGGEVQVGELPVVEGDPIQMRQLFQNLIGNALKFHKQGEKPLVKVHCSADNPVCQIIVEDNGIGFDEQCGERIFAPFQRLCGKSEYEGTGMGLAICKKIVERHGGSITVRSSPGDGSTFIITLPVSQRGGGDLADES
jgi:PAS domain S-box-containing protein